jgi:diguanylate cyclase (GGDEF)-like protein
MTRTLLTRNGPLWRTMKIVALSVGVTLSVGCVMSVLLFGVDPNGIVTAGYATLCTLVMGTLVTVALSGALSYRSSLLLQQLMQAQGKLERIARTDQLTGLLNRRGFDETATETLAEAGRSQTPAVALMCDIDHFKAINDRFGHEFGDAVLAQLGDVFRSFAERDGILVARHGGEEFAALMVGTPVDEVVLRAEHLRQMCAAKEITHAGVAIRVTVSIGIAPSHDETDLAKVMRNADDALYAAKRRGRNCVVRTGASRWQLDLLDEEIALSPEPFGPLLTPLEEARN